MNSFIGKKFGRLLVTDEFYKKDKIGHNKLFVKCKCECGNEKEIYKYSLTAKRPTVSCGCRLQEIHSNGINIKHNMTNTSIYTRWLGMKARCYNPNNKKYKRYGARGITVCNDWKNSFENFYNWAMSNGYRDDLTLDRINVNGDYEPENCRWVDMITQENNRTNNRHIYYNGNEYTLFDLSEISKVGYKTLHQRLYMYGWDVDKAVNTPSRIKNKNTLKNQKRTK